MSLLGVELVQEVVNATLLSGRIQGQRPLSLILIGEPESGKTSIVLEKETKTAVVLSDLTGIGLQFAFNMYPESTHLILTDLGAIMGHSPRAKEYFFSMLMPALEEGLQKVAGPRGIMEFKGAQKGLIACAVPLAARDKRQWWHRRGLASRMLPFNFTYPDSLVVKIKDLIDNDKIKPFQPGEEKLVVPDAHVKIELDSPERERVRKLADRKAKMLGERGIRLLYMYRALVRAHALLRTKKWKGTRVESEDVEFLARVDNYVEWDKSIPL